MDQNATLVNTEWYYVHGKGTALTLSVCLSVCLLACLCVCLSVYVFACLSVCGVSVCLPVCLYVCRSVCMRVCLPAYLSVCLSVCLSVFYYFLSVFYTRQRLCVESACVLNCSLYRPVLFCLCVCLCVCLPACQSRLALNDPRWCSQQNRRYAGHDLFWSIHDLF